MRRTTVGFTVTAALLVGATGCGSSASKAGGASASTVAGTSATSGTSATTAPGTATTVAAATTTVPSGAGVHVDVVITGTHAMVIKGTKGQCDPATKAFAFKGADYPVLGPKGLFAVSGAHGDQLQDAILLTPSTEDGALASGPAGLKVSADGKTATLDTDTQNSTPAGGVTHYHFKGTITCG